MTQFLEVFVFFTSCVVLGYCLTSIFTSMRYVIFNRQYEERYAQQMRESEENAKRWEQLASRIESLVDRVEKQFPPSSGKSDSRDGTA